MAVNVAIGIQRFDELIEKKCFYIDKTDFIREWWECNDSVTLINRPRRFGKTLNMSMVEQFFSIDYANRGDLFEGLSIWDDEEYWKLQGTYPVISLSFANIKEKNYYNTRGKICQFLAKLYDKFSFVRNSGVLTDRDKQYFDRVSSEMSDNDATLALYQLSDFLYRYYGKKVIILLDEYDTPMQEAYIDGYWDELVAFTRSLFNSTFKTNPWLERGIMTGITRVSKESVFSDLNNLKVVTTTSDEYDHSGVRPQCAEKPGESEKPEDTEKPGESEKPEDTEKPGEEEKPGESEKPEQPGTGNQGSAQTTQPAEVFRIAVSGKLHLVITGKNGKNHNASVIWKSGNNKFATINADGVVKFKKAGIGKTVTVTAISKADGKVITTAKIKILKNAVTGIKVKNPPKTLKAGKSITLKPVVSTSGKDANKQILWSSSNSKYLTVNSKGKVVAKKAGKGKTVYVYGTAADGSGKRVRIKIRIN